jgi:hypothetical protein
VGLIDRTTICSIEKSEKIENLSPNAIGWLADVGLRPSRVADHGRPDVRKCIAELMGAGPAKRECSASRLYRRETAAYLSGPSTKHTCKVPRQQIVAAGVKKQNVCLRSVLHNAMHNVESDHLELERIGGVQFGIYWDQIILACNLKAVAGVEEQAYICTRQGHGEVADFPIKTHLRQIDLINEFEASLF